MRRSARALGIVGVLLERAFQERDLKVVAELIDRGGRLLVLREDAMQFVDDALRQRATTCHAIHHKANGSLLVSQNVD